MTQPPQFTVRGLLLFGVAIACLLGLAQAVVNPVVPRVWSRFAFHVAVFWSGTVVGGLVGSFTGATQQRTWWGALGGCASVALIYALAAMMAWSRI